VFVWDVVLLARIWRLRKYVYYSYLVECICADLGEKEVKRVNLKREYEKNKVIWIKINRVKSEEKIYESW